jgi:hypothetical protein
VLRPALDVVSSTSLRRTESKISEKSFFSPLTPPTSARFKPLSTPPAIATPNAFYHFQGAAPRPNGWTHHKQKAPSSISSTTSRHHLLPGHDHAASAGSFDSIVDHKPLQHTGTSNSELNRLVMSVPGSQLPPHADHICACPSNSNGSAWGPRVSKALGRLPDPYLKLKRSPVQRKPSIDNASPFLTNTKAIPSGPILSPLQRSVKDYGCTPSNLSIINTYMYSGTDVIPHQNPGIVAHPPISLNDHSDRTNRQDSLPERGIALRPSPVQRNHSILQAPSVPSSVTNSTSSLTWASVGLPSAF